ncbi:MAG: hypothetical protein ACYCQK_01450 [Acidiferrobacteraceae bacterium]
MATRSFQGVLQNDTSRKPSDNVWRGCPWNEIQCGQRSGIALYEDFGSFPNTGANAQIPGWLVTGTTGKAVLLATDDGGVVQLQTTTGAQNDEAYAVYGNGVGYIAQILNATGNEFWFEARVRFSQITKGGYFVGLGSPADLVSGFLVNSTAVVASTAHAVGFNVANATPTKLDIVYADAAAPTTYVAGAQTIAAATWYKLGIHFFGNLTDAQNANQVHFYINGASKANTAGTKGVAASATNFPSSQPLTVGLCAKTPADTTDVHLDIDWVRAAVIIEDSTYG